MKKLLILLTLCLSFSFAGAQFDFGGGGGRSSGSSKPWADFKLPKKTLKLDFRNASVDMVLQLFTKTSGITIVKDPNLNQPITLTTAKAVPLEDAFEVLNAALTVRNYEMRKDGNLLVIRARQQSGRGGASGATGMSFDPSMFTQGSSSELKTYSIKYASASAVARVINDVFAQQGGGNPFANLPMLMQMGGRGGRGGGMNFGGFGQQASVRASADDYSNTVIVNAPRTTHRQVEDLIKEIDKQTEDPLRPQVYKLQFAMADDLQPVVQNVLQANLPKGRGGASGTTPVDRQFSFFPFGGNGGNNRNNAQAAQVVAEDRTNSLVVTTTEQNQKLVAQVIKELDTEVKLESTTFVFPLDNARADQIATLLRQAFGSRSGTGTSVNSGTGNQNRTNTGRTNTGFGNNNNRGGGTGFGGGGQANSDNELQLDLPDGVEAGDLMTNVAVQQGGIFGQLFGGGGQNNQRRNNQNTQQMGRNANGQLVPVQDLTGQVTVIPDQNTNSIIVVTSPENAALIRSLLNQLDKIPEQVMIETIIVEASLDSSSKLGFDWKFTQEKAFGNKGTTGTAEGNFGTATTGQGFRYTLSGGNLSAFLNALKTDTRFNVLSTPKIFTSNNTQAEINISQRVPFVVSQRTDANGNITYNYDFEDVGIVLTVTPRITAGGYVTMDVSQTANDLQGFTSFNAPIVNQRQAQTTVAVKDGETIILGGIIRSTVSSTVKKIPLLGDIPLLGQIFRSTDKSNQKTELLVFLSPRVVRNPDDAKGMTDEEKKKMSKPTQEQLDKTIKGGGNQVKGGGGR